MYNVKILKDSLAPCGKRLTTWELTYPRMVHAELMTHRLFSRNAASSRAIPNEKLRKRIIEDPALPLWWGKNQPGMQAREELTGQDLFLAKEKWMNARNLMLQMSDELATLGLHKQLCNRLIEPWMFITVILSATEFENWFHQRDHKDAQPEIAWVAKEMKKQYHLFKPTPLEAGKWHLPLFEEEDWEAVKTASGREDYGFNVQYAKKISAGRCARISYLTHDGKRDIREDISLHDKLLAGLETEDPLHMSPFEHVAQALKEPVQSGNFQGFHQYRKEFKGEHFGSKMP